MRMDRRELLRQFGSAAAATAFLPSLGEAASEPSVEAPDVSAPFVRLHRNENAYGPGEKAKAAFREALSFVNRYADEEAEKLRAAVAASQGVQPENITLGCGSTEVLRMAAETYLDHGKNLVMSSPTYESIANAARLIGAEVRYTPLTHEYAHDLSGMLARTDAATGILYICNPNNPTGTLTPKSELEALLPKVASGISVVVDEAYHDYAAPTGAYESWAARAAKDLRLIVTRTFSKVHGLAGLRVGYAISSAETAKRLAERRLPGNINGVAARVALAALSDTAHVKKTITLNSNDRQEFFNQANARMVRCLDSETNFVLMRTFSTGKETAEILKAKGVLVRAEYPGFEKHIRVSLGLPEEMRAFWSAWDAAMPHHPM